MAHYWANYTSESDRTEQKMRIDPCHLPQSIAYKGRQSGRDFRAHLTERGIFIQEQAANGAAKRRKAQARLQQESDSAFCPQTKGSAVLKILTPRQFLGIAACKITVKTQNAETQKMFCLLLLHEQADYSLPLLISAHKDDVLLDWRLWADNYNLPMLIMEEGRGFRPLGGQAALKLFINDSKIRANNADFLVRCRGLSLNTRLVLANQVMLS